MEILSYVAELIQSRKEIGIFGLGTIYKKKSPGRYDTATHTFLPPCFQIAFKQEQSENDLLARFISAQRNISRESADYFISVFVKDINDQLSNLGNADLSPLGTLTATEELLRFDPNPDFKTGFEFFGLPAVKNSTPTATENGPAPLPLQIETVENITEEELAETDIAAENPNDQPEEITMPEDVIEEVQEPETSIEDEHSNAEPIDIHALEQIETPESELLPESEEETNVDQEQIEMLEQESETNEFVTDNEPNLFVEPEAEIITSETTKEEEIQLENLQEEENPGQDSQEEIFTPSDITSETTTEEKIQLENLQEEENPGQDSQEETFTSSEVKETSKEDDEIYEEISENPIAYQPENQEHVISEIPLLIEQEETIAEEEFAEPLAESVQVPPSFYASNGPIPSESTIQYTIQENTQNTGTPTYVKVLIWITSALILIMVAYLVIPMLPESFRKPAITVDSTKKKATVIKTPVIADTVTDKDSITEAASAPVTVPAKKEVPVKQAVPVQTKVKLDTVTTYEIIGASVANEKEANQFIAQMKKSGVNAKVVTNSPGKRLKMSIATFKDQKEAALERTRLEKKLKIDGIYIYINKPK
ncbi:SPOR domain-containing protein [Pedobacter duraquae]|uniref:Sporulation related protein n=1 Tax=Pedobacter duraquae TaxID=425511 RepID=A0A4R6IRB9_9SPHI|nr:SPOR domain-containing protein [Pedobacter duraquae]TDO24974.1 sporulation related protein [Pedobacter duraquae]